MLRESAPPRFSHRTVVAWGLASTALFVGAVVFLMLTGTYDSWGAVLLAPALIVLSLPALSRQATREGDPTLFRLLVLALVFKLAGSIARFFVSSHVYGGVADAGVYNHYGVVISEGFRHGQFHTGLDSFVGTNFIRLFTGILYTAIGPTMLGGFLFYSWLGFWGFFFFYRAFVLAVPEGRARTYALLLFFLPSMLFWPSSIGKEAWMIFALGIAAFGMAHVFRGKTPKGLVIATSGLFLASMVRPHVAGLLGLALAVGFLFKKPSPSLEHMAPVVKLISLAPIVLLAVFLVARTDTYLKVSKAGGSFASIAKEVTGHTNEGGSNFHALSILRSPSHAPVAAFTVLFRPLPLEAHNTTSLLASLETTFLLCLCLVRFRWILAALRSIRRRPYVAAALAYIGLFIIAFSVIANFGILARQRVQLLPFLFVFLCIPPATVRGAQGAELGETERLDLRTSRTGTLL